mmetsp:Transcript_9153/g.27549  ORF Transcript_9153/g.27549 Transcript_9153/m.27549 type:complete len:270 (-) Transcript_9153:158-967(-)|eukprot:CAMPEP_0198727000 /NCGR_PEP_ID=MMETSP1475-20131203/3855_1 /TAXON_ID= ORGANISM="Unidentified sp., Strain CCMP1999" /NCGR_SAMPLE_ID=MMETSP1475 /ASSEMBLY_ACC=CAM_ASM_001111 /LENGTH=269 /DNA_ID=CAMNT_0044488985 /DNA_START=137 /DNA_END=946 /DNA_ORIENTATION=+
MCLVADRIVAPVSLPFEDVGRSLYKGEEDGFRRVYNGVMQELLEHFDSMSGQRQEDGEPKTPATFCKDTVFLFDWDDTVMPTTFLGEEETRRGYLTLSSYARFKFLELDRLVVAVLRKASTFGKVVIVTNAADGWVQMSAARYMPMVNAMLNEGNIKIISARSNYFEQFPEAPLEWKVHAFQDELSYMKSAVDGRLNLIVLGDSLSDQYAAHTVVSRLEETLEMQAVLKFVKLIDRPSLEQVQKQMSLVLLNIDRLVSYKSAFDICVAT